MKKFKTLFLMQMREKTDLSFLKDKKKTLFKVVFSLLYFVVLVAMCYLILYLAQLFHLFSPLNHIPLTVMAVVLFVMIVFNLISCTMTLTNSLYFSKDNQVLITFPASPNTLFLSKIFVHFTYELKKTFTFIVPVFLAYGIISSISFVFYIWMPIMMILLSAFIVFLAGLLSIPMIYVKTFFDRYSFVRIILTLIVLGFVVWGVIAIVNAIPENIDLIRSWAKVSKAIDTFLTWFSTHFSIVYALCMCICGIFKNFQMIFFTKYTWIVSLILIGVVGVLFVLNYYISRPIYLKIISTKFEYNKSKKINRPNHLFKSKYSTLVYESVKDLRNTTLVRTTLTLLVVAPIAVLTLNKIYAAINTALFGTHLTVAFNILIILLFVLSHNISASSVYSRDGESLYMLKTLPSRPHLLLLSRLGYYAVTTIVLLSVIFGVYLSFAGLAWTDAVLMFLAILMYAFIHILASAEIDFLHPQSALFRTEGLASKNPNEVKSILLAFGMSFLLFGLALFFYIKDPANLWLKLFLVIAAVFAYKLYLFCYKAKVLFKEVL